MRLPPEFLNELKMRNDIESVISPYVVLKRRGNNLVGLCPFHNEKTPSFTVWPENGSFYCFGCGAGGDAITFMMQIERLDYIEAVRALAERSGMQMPAEGVDDRLAKLRSRIYEANRAAARFFYEQLISPGGKKALGYLTGRGLQAKTIKQFGLGFAPDGWTALTDHLRSLGFTDDEMKSANLVTVTKRGTLCDRFRNRVIFPVMDVRGNFVAFSGRRLNEDDPGGKYVNTSDTPVYKKSDNLFGLFFAKNHCSKRLILVEGNMDVIQMHQAGFNMTAAPLGTAFTKEQARLIARYTDEVVVTLDADAAGKKATEKVLAILQEVGVKARILRLPECKDPDEFIKKKGAARFEALLDGAVSDTEYRLHEASDGLDLDTSDGKLEYLNRAILVLAALNDDMARDLYAGRLSEVCGVSKDAILMSTAKARERKHKEQVRKELDSIVRPKVTRDPVNPQKALYPRAAAAEEMLTALLIAHPDMYDRINGEISPDDFVTDFGKRLFGDVCEALSDGGVFNMASLGGSYTPAEMGHIAMLENLIPTGDDIERAARESISVIKTEKLLSGTSSELTTDEWAKRMEALANSKIKRDKNTGDI